ncbi:MAG: M23 family metallopeptidase [Defluviitaleaceae bacterium]|nr:M23 family metallopeptidase [Defluviitaleaceae bacterium]
MKNVSEPDSIFRKKGFFIALYSCLGVIAVLAVVVTLFSTGGGPDPYDQEPTAYVGADQVDTYLTQAEEEAWFRPRQTPAPPPPAPPEPPPEPEPPPAPAPPPPRVETFEPFTEENRFVWPVYGEVIMPFSVTSLIFDPTMDRFSTNDNIRIAAFEGDPVRAGADGRIVGIGTDFWRGNYVTIDHGNGWLTTLGQLMENVLVREGDVVRAGQVIGGIGQPAISSSLNGTHVHLHITRDDVPMNPYDFLQAVYD